MKFDPSIKNKLLSKCFEYVDQRIETSRQAMKNAQDSANTEEKSSAGDKYETGRAMAQIERDKAAQQLEEAMKLKSILNQLNPLTKATKVSQGSLVITDTHRFYLAISMGKIKVEDVDFLILSPNSPIGQALLSLKESDSFTFNKETHLIKKIL